MSKITKSNSELNKDIGIDDNATSTAITIDSAENVGIGTSTELAPLSVASSAAVTMKLTKLNTVAITGNLGATLEFNHSQSAADGADGESTSAIIQAQPVSGWGGILAFSTKNADGVAANAPTERMRIDSAGRVTMPYQPAFSAYLSASVAVTQGWNTVIPNTAYFNVGNNYSTSTGYFTAPVAGRYLFASTFHTNVSTNYLYLGVHVNNAHNTPYFEGRNTVNDEYTSDNTLGGSTILNLAAGDTVRLRCFSDVAFSISGANTRTSFSGYLLG